MAAGTTSSKDMAPIFVVLCCARGGGGGGGGGGVYVCICVLCVEERSCFVLCGSGGRYQS